MDGLVERAGAVMSALPTWGWIALAAAVALALWLVLRTPRRVKIANQQRYVESLEDANQTHPGLYEVDLARERAELERLRK